MPTRNFRNFQCYIVYGDGKQPMKLSWLKNIELLIEDSTEVTCPIHIDCETSFTLQLTKDATCQMIAIANGYQNYNCMQRDIRRQKRNLKEMRKRAKKVKYGTAKTD